MAKHISFDINFSSSKQFAMLRLIHIVEYEDRQIFKEWIFLHKSNTCISPRIEIKHNEFSAFQFLQNQEMLTKLYNQYLFTIYPLM